MGVRLVPAVAERRTGSSSASSPAIVEHHLYSVVVPGSPAAATGPLEAAALGLEPRRTATRTAPHAYGDLPGRHDRGVDVRHRHRGAHARHRRRATLGVPRRSPTSPCAASTSGSTATARSTVAVVTGWPQTAEGTAADVVTLRPDGSVAVVPVGSGVRLVRPLTRRSPGPRPGLSRVLRRVRPAQRDDVADRQKSMSPPPGMPPPAPAGSGLSAMTASVVRNRAAIDAAFCSAERVTLAASMTPSLTRSSYSPVAALRPSAPLRSRTRWTTTPPSRPAFSAICLSGASSALDDQAGARGLVALQAVGGLQHGASGHAAGRRHRRARRPPRWRPSSSRRRPRCGASSPSAPPRWRRRP